MNRTTALILAAAPLLWLTVTGCQVSHTETDKPGLLGGNTHEETTTTKNPITGDTSTSHAEQKTN